MMLASINRFKPNRFIKNSILRTLSSNNIVTNNASRTEALKQSFANEKIHEKAHIEFQKTQLRVLTIPNILTISRIATTPAIGYFIWTGANSQALACFAYAALTDLLDGFIARKFKQDSDLGAILDPIADKLLLTTCFVALYHASLMPFWLVRSFVIRDVLILFGGALYRYHGFREKPGLKKFLDFKNYPTLGFEPTLTSKCNTALQCLLVLLHLSTNHLTGQPTYDWTIAGLHYTVLLTTAASFSQYVVRLFTHPYCVRTPKSRT